jgi:hypothetical protein
MTEEELRALVREAIARVGPARPDRPASLLSSPPYQTAADRFHPFASSLPMNHASHVLFMVPAGADAEGPCLIEPTVMCNHCGYCKSYGH